VREAAKTGIVGSGRQNLLDINEALCSFLQVENLRNFHLCKESPETCNYGSKQNNDEITASRDSVELTLSSFLLGLSQGLLLGDVTYSPTLSLCQIVNTRCIYNKPSKTKLYEKETAIHVPMPYFSI